MNLITKILSFLLLGLMFSCATEKDSLVTISTQYGDMNIILYDETPEHKQNFLKLAENNRYDSTIFHRVIKGFMVQGGDVNAKKGNKQPINYTIPAEFHDHLIHEKGALSAARQGDEINPKKESSGDQFYIVHGTVYEEGELEDLELNQNTYRTHSQFAELLKKPEYGNLRRELVELQKAGDLEGMQAKLEESKAIIEKEFGIQEEIKFSALQKEKYTTVGGAPHLDGTYTVFGKVIGGLSVIDSIANQPTGRGDKPLKDIYMKLKVEEVSKESISKKFGYQYPKKE